MNNPNFIKIPFYEEELLVIMKDNIPYTAIRPISESLGFSWSSQLKRIKRDPVLSKGVVIMTTPSDGGNQEMICLPMKYLHGWLFKINPTNYKDERREKVIRYQEECYEVLCTYFNDGGAINPKASNQQLSMLQAKIEYYKQFVPNIQYGVASELSGRKRIFLHRAYYQASPRKPHEININQPELPIWLSKDKYE